MGRVTCTLARMCKFGWETPCHNIRHLAQRASNRTQFVQKSVDKINISLIERKTGPDFFAPFPV